MEAIFMAQKAAAGGLKIGASAGTQVLTAAILKYYGLH
jgi:hypothetical protein